MKQILILTPKQAHVHTNLFTMLVMVFACTWIEHLSKCLCNITSPTMSVMDDAFTNVTFRLFVGLLFIYDTAKTIETEWEKLNAKRPKFNVCEGVVT